MTELCTACGSPTIPDHRCLGLIARDLEQVRSKVPLHSVWEHRLTGKRYIVTAIAVDETTTRIRVIYTSLDGTAIPWGRKAVVFLDDRFERVQAP